MIIDLEREKIEVWEAKEGRKRKQPVIAAGSAAT